MLTSFLLGILLSVTDTGLQRPDVEYKIFQFPADQIPRIDGVADDWSIVPDEYAIGMDQLKETVAGMGQQHDPKNLDVKVKVGWVKGLNQLYFLYEASDNYWDFASPDLHNDIFEVVVDGDLSGGPLIRQMHPNTVMKNKLDTHFSFHGVHLRRTTIFRHLPRARIGRWSGAASRGSGNCPMPMQLDHTSSNMAKVVSSCLNSSLRLLTLPLQNHREQWRPN